MDGGQENQLMAVLTLSPFLRKAEDISWAITPKAYLSMFSKELEEESSKSKNKSVLSAVYFDQSHCQD